MAFLEVCRHCGRSATCLLRDEGRGDRGVLVTRMCECPCGTCALARVSVVPLCGAPAAALGRARHSVSIDDDGLLVWCSQCRLYVSQDVALLLHLCDGAVFEDPRILEYALRSRRALGRSS